MGFLWSRNRGKLSNCNSLAEQLRRRRRQDDKDDNDNEEREEDDDKEEDEEEEEIGQSEPCWGWGGGCFYMANKHHKAFKKQWTD